MDCSRQAPLSVGFPRKEYWSGLPFPSPGDLPDPRIKPMSPALAGGFFTTEPPGKPEDLISKKWLQKDRKMTLVGLLLGWCLGHVIPLWLQLTKRTLINHCSVRTEWTKPRVFGEQVFVIHSLLALLGGGLRVKIWSSLEEAISVRGDTEETNSS